MSIENVYDELKKITKILLTVYSDTIDAKLESIATTADRRRIWISIDGEHTSNQIAEKIDVSKRSVDRFLKILENIGLVNNPWGKPPTKVIDHIPEKWNNNMKSDDKFT